MQVASSGCRRGVGGRPAVSAPVTAGRDDHFHSPYATDARATGSQSRRPRPCGRWRAPSPPPAGLRLAPTSSSKLQQILRALRAAHGRSCLRSRVQAWTERARWLPELRGRNGMQSASRAALPMRSCEPVGVMQAPWPASAAAAAAASLRPSVACSLFFVGAIHNFMYGQQPLSTSGRCMLGTPSCTVDGRAGPR